MRKSKYLGIVAILFVSALVVGCEPLTSYPIKFHEGDLVMMKADSRVGTVLSVLSCKKGASDIHHSCDYHVRFSTRLVSTDTHLLSKDGPLETEPYGELVVYDYELAPAK